MPVVFCHNLILRCLPIVAVLWMSHTHLVAVAQVENSAGKDTAGKTAKVTYDDQIRPLLKRRCSSCHNGDRTEADLNVVNFLSLMQGGGSGAVIEPGSADDSYLFRLVNHDDSPEMPPGGEKIASNEITLLRNWIDQGALENQQSRAKKRKPKLDLTKVSANPNVRPEVTPALPRIPMEPALWTPRKSPARAIAINPWAPIAAVAAPRQVVLYDMETLELKGVIPFPAGRPETLRFSRNGALLLIGGGVAGDSGVVVMWDVATGQVVSTIGDELDTVLACDITPDHSLLALGGPKKVVRVYSTADGTLQYELKKHTDWVTAIEFSPGGENLASGDRNGGLIVSDAQTGNQNFDLVGHKMMITSVAWRIDGKILGSTSKDKSVRLWEMRKGKQIKTWAADDKGVTELCFLSDGNLLTAGRDHKVKFWQQDAKHLRTFAGLKEMAMGLAWCTKSKRVIAGSLRGEVMVWSIDDPQPVGKLNCNPPPIVERIADVNRQLSDARTVVATDEVTLKNHDVVLEQITGEMSEVQNKLDDAIGNIADATAEMKMIETRIASAKATQKKINTDLANVGAQDTSDSPHTQPETGNRKEQLKLIGNRIVEMGQRLTVLNNQIVAWDGASAGTAGRIADLQEETGRLRDARKPLVKKLDASRAHTARLEKVLGFWQAEAEFAKSTRLSKAVQGN